MRLGKVIVFAAVLLSCGPALACDTGDSEVWHVLVQNQNGQVSLLKNMTKSQAIEVSRRLDPSPPSEVLSHYPRPVPNKDGMYVYTNGLVSFRSIVKVEAFGPSCELDVYPKEWFDGREQETRGICLTAKESPVSDLTKKCQEYLGDVIFRAVRTEAP